MTKQLVDAANGSPFHPMPDLSDEGVDLLDFHAHMPSHKYIFAPSGDLWPAISVNARVPPVVLRDDAGNILLDEHGSPKTISATEWLDSHRSVEQITWCPGQPQRIADRLVSDGGWIDRPGCACFNLYRPPRIAGGNAREASLWLDHVRRVYPGEAEQIIAWLAHRVQRPQDKINHALVLGGLQGIGKDTILEPVKMAVGPWNFVEVLPTSLLGRFNGYAKSVILRINEGRDLGEGDRYSLYDRLKVYTAAPPDVLRVDEKNLREHAVWNVCGVIITTNHKADGLYLPADDRRHFVAWSNLTKDDFTPQYFERLYSWYDHAGSEHVAAYLRELDISQFNPKAPPPKTSAFWDIADANQPPEQAELADALELLGRPHAVTLAELAGVANDGLAEWLRDRRNTRHIPHRLEKAGYIVVRNPDAVDGLWRINGRRQAIYANHELPPRDRLAVAIAVLSRGPR